MRITRENTVGLIIDIQEKLFPAMANSVDVLKHSKNLIEGLQVLNIPLLFTQQYTKGLGETVEPIRSLIPNFKAFEKHDFSCCDESTITEKLKLKGARYVILCGMESHICVLQTAIDLQETGYVPVVVMDCVASRTQESVKWAAERLRHEGIMMTSAEAVLFELTRSSAAPEFRTISKIIK